MKREQHKMLLSDLNSLIDLLTKEDEFIEVMAKYLYSWLEKDQEYDEVYGDIKDKLKKLQNCKNTEISQETRRSFIDSLCLSNIFVNFEDNKPIFYIFAKCWIYELNQSVYLRYDGSTISISFLKLSSNKDNLKFDEVISLNNKVTIKGYSNEIKLSVDMIDLYTDLNTLSEEMFKEVTEW